MSNQVKDEISLQVRKMMTTKTLDSNPGTSGERIAHISREPHIDQKEARANEIEGQMKKFRENRSSDLRKNLNKIEKVPSANIKQGLLNETTKTSGKVAKNLSKAQILHRIAWGVGVFLGLGAIVGLLMTGLLIFQNHLFYGSVSYTTTTKVSGLTTLNVGQLCQWNNQCPTNAYCLGTCQCSDTTYFDSSSGACVAAGTIGSGCTYDYHCNRVQRLTCDGGFCSCENVNMIWNNAYSGGGGIISGRCQLRSGEGKTSGLCFLNSDTSGVTYGSASSICTCDLTYGLNFDESNYDCTYTLPYSRCVNSYECGPTYTACMNIDGDNYTKCTPLPTAFYIGGYGFKSTYGGNCNLYQPCNEFQNLKCSDYLYGNGTVYGTCVCYSKYYYWNGTMCILGTRYGENCTLSSTCVPTSASMSCLAPYSGASYTVCRCTSSQYYNLAREVCNNLKGHRSLCRDSTECYDGYPRGSAIIDYGYCGIVPGGSWPVCLCINGYYATCGGCGCSLNTGFCNFGYTVPQCPNNQYCTSGGTCACINEKYLSSGVCYWLKYQGDSCTSGTECWSGNCVSSACT